jgi:formylglycine-generating enzyme required for sulfatase activity
MSMRWIFPIVLGVLGVNGVVGAEEASPQPYAQEVPGAGVSIEMVPIPAGKFMMGSPSSESGRKADEGPQREVEVDAFWIGKYEVTWEQYRAFMAEYHIKPGPGRQRLAPGEVDADAISMPTNLWEEALPKIVGGAVEIEPKWPAVGMTQHAARQFTKWLSKKTGRFYRLPTEAEWEYACRAGATTAWCFGDDPAELEHHGWFFDNGTDHMNPVGLKKPNKWGVHDMHGNAAEYVIDAWREAYAGGPGPMHWREAIVWPPTEHPVVVRGGNMDSNAEDTRSAARLASSVAWREDDPNDPTSVWWETKHFMGLRVVRPATEPDAAEKQRFWETTDPGVKKIMLNDGKQMRVLITPADK